MPDTVRDLLREALEEINVVGTGETFEDEDAERALTRYNRLLDAWNAERGAVYADQFVSYTLTPSLSPHTIGPTGATWTVTQRPVSIEGASLFLASTPDVKTPIDIRNAAWWNNQRVPSLTSSIPTDLYPDYTWPNGSLYFWPVPDTAYEVELWTRIVLAQVTLDTTFSLPPANWRAHVLSVAEECCRPFRVQATADLREDASAARALAFGVNRERPRISTRDAGMPQSGRTKTYNFLTRQM